MKSTCRNILFFFVVLAMTVKLHAQTSHEKQMILSITAEQNPKKKFSRMMSLAEYYKTNNLERADSMRYVLMEESKKLDDSIRFNAVLYFAEVALIRGDLDVYFNTILSSQSYVNRLGTDDASFKIYRHLGFYNSTMQDFELAKFYLNKALTIGKKRRNYSWVSEVEQYLAINFMLENEKDSATVHAERAINFARRSGNRLSLAKSFNTQAKVYRFFGQVELSVAKNLIALQIAEEQRNPILVSQYSREVGRAQKLILNFKDAEFYFTKSFEQAAKIHDQRQQALALSDLASIYLEKRDFINAIRTAERAIDLLTPLNDQNGLGETHDILGRIYEEKGDYTKASINFNQALVYFESTNNKEKIAEVYHNVGSIFKAQGKYNNALNYLFRSIEIREQFGAKNQVYHTYRVIADVYKITKNKEKALEYMELYVSYLDSNTTLQAATKIAELSESYRAEQRERLISSQADSLKRQLQEKTLTATKLENSQLRNNLQMYFIIAFLIIILLGGVIVYSRWNQTKIRQQQVEAEMSQKLLRLQMNPHFVFNAMSVIQSYIYDNDTVNSAKFLVSFSRLMRLILENSPKETIPIEIEMEILQKYLEIQKLRFQDRFSFEIYADECLLEEGVIIPPMITQPFIENAIEHGQLHTIADGFIKVAFTKRNDLLEISIIDNGIGRTGSRKLKKTTAHKSMAMDITRQRIDTLNKKYRTESSLLIEDFDKVLETGTKVLISLPYTTESNQTA